MAGETAGPKVLSLLAFSGLSEGTFPASLGNKPPT
jgi:hypothetical protein